MVSFPLPNIIPNDPGYFTKSWAEWESQIMEAHVPTTSSRAQLTDSVKIIAPSIWVFYGFMILITTVFIKNFYKINLLDVIWNIWSLFRGFPNEINNLSKISYRMILIGHLLMVSLFMITLYKVTISSELVVPVKPVVINSLDDMLKSKKFPLFFGSNVFSDHFRFSTPDLLPGKIWSKAREIGFNKTIIKFNNKSQFVSNTGMLANWMTSACISMEIFLDFLNVYYCNINTDLKTRRSKEKFAKSIYSFLYSKNTSTQFRRQLNHG